MKKIFYILASAIVALGAVACNNEGLDNIAPEANGDTVSFVASIDNTKTDLKDLQTTWTAGDVINVVWNGETYAFKNSAEDVNTFSCTAEGLSAIVNAEVTATYSKNGDGKIDSTAGTAGALLTYDGYFAELQDGTNGFTVQNAFLTITADNGAAIVLTASADIFSTGKSLALTATSAEQYIAVNPGTTTIALSINGEAIKTSQENTIAAKKIYNLGNYYKKLDEIEKEKRYIFKQATELAPGKWYAIVAENKAATAITSTYGYLKVVEPIALTEGISLPASCAWGIVSTDGGYTIQQYDGKYVYQIDTYDSFNVDAAVPASGHVWTIENGVVTNASTSKTVQYDTQYDSYGCYASVKGVYPAFYELVEVDSAAHILGTSQSSLSFTAEGGETTFTVTTYGSPDWSAVSNQTWAQVDFKTETGEVLVSVGTNEGEAREAEVTVTFGEESATVTVSQAAKPSDATLYFTKVTTAPTDWSGTYLIVYEPSKIALDGSRTTLDAEGNHTSVTIANNQIEATSDVMKIAFTIEKSTTANNYYIKSASGYYIGNTSDQNKLISSKTTKYSNTLTMSGTDVDVVSASSHLRFNSSTSAGNNRFRYYKSGTYTSQKAIQLYKLNE